jgi:RNA polymerase-binding protein
VGGPIRTIHSGNTGVLGHRVGAGGRPGEPDNLISFAPRIRTSFVCEQKHETICNFAETAAKAIPASWPCTKCGRPASRGDDPGQAPPPEHELRLRQVEHLQRVKERRSPEQAAEILNEALARRRQACGQ